ncbi:DltE Short-chain dehydrogenase involved in D-alanine esterification of lipoteichoic acid and wall teichoic acid (D-alanine transfer protein) [Comamonadaceae bacterium]
MNWNQTHALVTGGTRGIGRALVALLLEKGARVTATGRTGASVDQASLECPGARWIVFDQSDEQQRAELVAQMQGKGVNLLIHNAGVQQLHDFTQEGETLQFTTELETAINFVGPVELSRAMLPQLRDQAHARIVFVTSGLALAPKRSSPVYCANKAGLRSFAKSLRAQLRHAHWGIEVTEALPPLVDTDMTRGRGRGKITAETAARQIVAGIQAGKPEIYVGASALLRVISRISPALAEAIMINR